MALRILSISELMTISGSGDFYGEHLEFNEKNEPIIDGLTPEKVARLTLNDQVILLYWAPWLLSDSQKIAAKEYDWELWDMIAT